ncbi:MAG: hypothetical protein IPH26_08730 [Sterolibacteriaceae bacterium]|uniref:Apple domain-containing protein n=1 Tax=Candidatus Methylophosphatis roskildensis TaxID=2899263 RepID=A0A9D7E2M2_9PROT|nr:hypothetical protein [Candidatus Methylophosphatis roskildensis]MBK7237577.1 hypothetical protein [Sterolibacteriaceae bacterium]
MSKLLGGIAIAIALVLTVTAAQAGDQLTLVQRTFDALRQSATALEQGDAGKAQALLAGIKSSAEALRGTAERFGKQAAAAAEQREAEARAVTTKITETYQAEQAADKEIRELEAQIATLTVQLEAANTMRNALEAQAAVYRREVAMRNECKNQPLEGIFYSGECWRLSFEDVFANRWIALNNNIKDNNTQRNNIENARHNLNGQLNSQQGKLGETRARKAQLEAQRTRLEQQVKTLRAAVVSLSDASVFWTDTVTLIGSKITSIETLQQSLQILAKRANRTSTAPVFDSYDKEAVRSLEATLIDFARTLDNNTNILLLPKNGGSPSGYCAPPVAAISITDAALAAGRARGTWSRTKSEDWQNWIGAARCVSPAAIYYGKFPNVQECENRCIADPTCTFWSYNAMYQGNTNPVWANSLQECWGGSSALTPNKTQPVWGGFLSGGIR